MSHPIGLIAKIGGRVTGLIHVGANVGEEVPVYHAAGIRPSIMVEANPEIFPRLCQTVANRSGVFAVRALCADVDGATVPFHIADNDGQSSSLLEFGWHKKEHAEVGWAKTIQLETTRLDTLVVRLSRHSKPIDVASINCLVMDTQGAEMIVLRGAPSLLQRLDYIYAEVNEGGMYEGDCSLDELTAFVKDYGFRLNDLHIHHHGWGDALYVRRKWG